MTGPDRQAGNEGYDVVLIDTAGRMQDNEPLMRALAKLVAVNNPNLILFVGQSGISTQHNRTGPPRRLTQTTQLTCTLRVCVGEALVGNDAVDQLQKFNQCLVDMSHVSSVEANENHTLGCTALRCTSMYGWAVLSGVRCVVALQTSKVRTIDGILLTKFDTVDDKVRYRTTRLAKHIDPTCMTLRPQSTSCV